MKTPRGSTLADVQRTHILRVLAETNAILGGPRGAALRMGMKRTTLQSLMKRPGIAKPRALSVVRRAAETELRDG